LALTPSGAETSIRYDYGYCYGIAGRPRLEDVTRVFVLGPENLPAANGIGDPGYQAEIKARFNDVFPQQTGCSMAPTLKEAEVQRQALIDGVPKALGPHPIVVLGWLPRGATALSGDAATPSLSPAPAVVQPQTTTAPNATPKGSDEKGPYWACAASVKGVQYDTAIFAGPNLFPQQLYWEYFGFLGQKYGGGAMPNCESRPTRAEAETFLAQHAAGTIPGATSVITQRVATGRAPPPLRGTPL